MGHDGARVGMTPRPPAAAAEATASEATASEAAASEATAAAVVAGAPERVVLLRRTPAGGLAVVAASPTAHPVVEAAGAALAAAAATALGGGSGAADTTVRSGAGTAETSVRLHLVPLGDELVVSWLRASDLDAAIAPGSAQDRRGRTAPPASATTAAAVERALAGDEFVLHYQPVADLTDWRSGGVEALVRWQHPTLGLLAPARFLPEVEASGAMGALGDWVLETAVRQVADWQRDHDLTYFRVGINVSPEQLETADVPGRVGTLLRHYGVPADRFIVEILETQALTRRAAVARRVHELLRLGLRVAIDDFGGGFANMSYLRDLPVDVIKVDRSLVGLHPTARDEAILRAVVGVATAVSADVLLEGIESVEHVTMARRAGVRFGQGLLIGPPAPAGAGPPMPAPLPPGI